MQITNPLKIFLTLLVFSIVIGYSAFRFADYFRGPAITIESPRNGSTVSEGFLSVSGSAEAISRISLNGKKIFTSPDGDFDEKILLTPGYNAFQVKVEDRFGRIETKTLQLVYDKPNYAPTQDALTQNEETSNLPSS